MNWCLRASTHDSNNFGSGSNAAAKKSAAANSSVPDFRSRSLSATRSRPRRNPHSSTASAVGLLDADAWDSCVELADSSAGGGFALRSSNLSSSCGSIGLLANMGEFDALEEWHVIDLGQELCPRERTTQTHNRSEVGSGVLFDGQCPLQQLGMMLAEPDNLTLLRGGTKPTGRFDRHGQTGLADRALTRGAVHVPIARQRVSVAEIPRVQERLARRLLFRIDRLRPRPRQPVLFAGVQADRLHDPDVRAPLLTGIEADRTDHALVAPDQFVGRKVPQHMGISRAAF